MSFSLSQFSSRAREILHTLKKINPAHENAFEKANQPLQSTILKYYICITFLQCLIILASNPSDRSDFEYYFLKFSEIIGTFLIYLLGRKKLMAYENLIFLINCLTFFGLCESLRINIEKGENLPSFMIGILIEVQALTMIIAKMDFIRVTFFILITNTLCTFRYLPFQENSLSKYFPLVYIIFNTVFMSTISYLNEKSERRNFYSDREQIWSLNCFKTLIQDILPNPIIILQDENVLFANEEALTTFSCKDNSEVFKKFANITIDSNSESLLQVFHESFERENNINSKKDTFKNFSKRDILLSLIDDEKNIFKSGKDLERFTLYDLLKMKSNYFKSRNSFLKLFLGAFHKEASAGKIYFDIKITNIRWDEKSALMIIFSENNTVKEINFLKQQNLHKDNLLATVSHDLRTPLNGIISILNETINSISDVYIKKNLIIAFRSAKYLLFMINDILDFYQISNGKLRLNFEYFSIWDVILEVSKLIKFQAKLKGLKFCRENKIPKIRTKGFIRSDPNRLKQVLLNLLGNALKFTTTGSITISVEENTTDLEEEIPKNKNDDLYDKPILYHNESFVIKVTDTGMGIKEEDQNQLFKQFGRVDNASTNALNKAGIGLGLSISQDIVRILNNNISGGEIKVSSKLGQGSCFSFPINSNKEILETEEFLNSELKEPHINKVYTDKVNNLGSERHDFFQNSTETIIPNIRDVNLLVVEDDQVSLLITSSFLRKNKEFKFDTACNGFQALELIKRKASESKFYDIVLMDCNMPVVNGFEASQLIKGLIKSGLIPSLFIIACTANNSPSDIEEFSSYGFDDHIIKPFSREELLLKLNKYSKKLL